MRTFSLSRISPELYDSIADYRREMIINHDSFDGCSGLEKYEDIEKWHRNVILFEKEDTLPPGYSIGIEYAYLRDGEVAGLIDLRPKATEHVYLSRFGGHIGYSVRPSLRKQGIGTRMLKDMLKVCKDEYHLEKVLITCVEGNVGSKKVIMNNGGILEGKIFYPPEEKMIDRDWISL